VRSGGRVWATSNEPKSQQTGDVCKYVQYIIIILCDNNCKRSAIGCFLYIFCTSVCSMHYDLIFFRPTWYTVSYWCTFLLNRIGYGGELFSWDLPPCWIVYSNNQKYSNVMVHVGDRRLQPTIADASEQAHQIPDPPVGVHYLFMFISWFVYYAAFSGRPVSASSDFTCFLFHKRGRTHQSRLRLLGNPLRKRLPHCCKVPRLFTTSLALSAFHLSKRISLTVEF